MQEMYVCTHETLYTPLSPLKKATKCGRVAPLGYIIHGTYLESAFCDLMTICRTTYPETRAMVLLRRGKVARMDIERCRALLGAGCRDEYRDIGLSDFQKKNGLGGVPS